MYKKLIYALSSFKNGKYASQIKNFEEFNREEDSDVIKTGVNDSRVTYHSSTTFLDEILNETEALELSNQKDIHTTQRLQDKNRKNSATGNYINIYNILSGYKRISGYGPILKSLLGKEDCFKAEYISSVEIFKKFDEEYADIVKDVWGLNPQEYPPIECICEDITALKNDNKAYDEQIMLKLDEFFAKCYEKKVGKLVTQGLNAEQKDKILKEIEIFQSRLTTNDDPNKRDALAHNVIFNNIKARINNKQQEIQQNNQLFGKKDTKTMEFIEEFIQEYDDAEDKSSYKKRATYSKYDIEVLKRIIKLDGKDDELSIMEREMLSESPSFMIRLLKAAQLLTGSKKLNPQGIDYLEEFVNVPEVHA